MIGVPSSVAVRQTASRDRAIGGATRSRIRRLLSSGLVWSAVVSAGFAAWILIGLHGADYYRTPLAVRGYAAQHALLRPSGPAGQMFGLIGFTLMLMPFAYMARKRAKKGPGTLRGWLEVHLFCGVVGPVLVTFHTSFKFNGIVSAAYWSMAIVVSSGFLGRYLYVRIPRSIRGNELTRVELDARVDETKDELVAARMSGEATAAIERFELALAPRSRYSWVDLLFGELRTWRHRRALDRALTAAGVDASQRRTIGRLTSDRAMLMRRIAYLQRTKKLFDLWHVFHLPLVYVLLVIVAAHVAVTFYLGYVPFRW